MKTKAFSLCLVFALATFLAGCGSGGGLGDIGLGDILGSSTENDNSDVRGTVVHVDTRDQRIDLDVDMVNNLRDDRRGSTIYYDSNTVVEYQGNQYRVEDLERGDEIEIRGSNRSGRFVAERIRVTRDVSR